jgi:hypothetical protein
MAQQKTVKHLLIDKANTTMLAIISVASFLVVFSLVASKSLLSQNAYQQRVIKEKEKTLKQLRENNKNVTSLVDSYHSFANSTQNLLGGNPAGTGPKDGDNPKIVLDALPSKYDFPGLSSSVEKVLKDGGYAVEKISGIDDELAQQQAAKTDSTAPVPMPFLLSFSSSYDGTKKLFTTFEHSIRPIYVNKITLVAVNNSQLKTTIDANTFYQPAKELKITTKVVK